MMKNVLITIALFLTLTAVVPAQEVFSSKRWGFEVTLPKFWVARDTEAYESNINNFKLSEDSLKAILDGDKGTRFIASYYFNEPGRLMSLRPQLVLSAHKKTPAAFETFKRDIVRSSGTLKTAFPDIVLSKAAEVDVAGLRSVLHVGSFTMVMPDKSVLKARSRIYSIPLNNYFFQLTLNDGQDPATDFSVVFDEIVKSIKIVR